MFIDADDRRGTRCIALLAHDGFARGSLRFSANVAVMFEHLLKTCRAISIMVRTTFRQFRNYRVSGCRASERSRPGFRGHCSDRLQLSDRTYGVAGLRFSEQEDVPLRPNLMKSVRLPSAIYSVNAGSNVGFRASGERALRARVRTKLHHRRNQGGASPGLLAPG
jgi:hypothetical protein